jgi:hypothetical protein
MRIVISHLFPNCYRSPSHLFPKHYRSRPYIKFISEVQVQYFYFRSSTEVHHIYFQSTTEVHYIYFRSTTEAGPISNSFPKCKYNTFISEVVQKYIRFISEALEKYIRFFSEVKQKYNTFISEVVKSITFISEALQKFIRFFQSTTEVQHFYFRSSTGVNRIYSEVGRKQKFIAVSNFRKTTEATIKSSRATSRVKWLNGEKTNVSRSISVLVLRVPKWLEFPSVSYIAPCSWLHASEQLP